MFRFNRAAIAFAVVGGAAALALASAGPASAAAPTGPDLSLSVGPGALSPADGGGYAGYQRLTLRNASPSAAAVDVVIDRPEGVAFAYERDFQLQACFPVNDAARPRAVRCALINGLAGNETRDLSLRWTSLAAPQRKHRITTPATITVDTGAGSIDPTPGNNTVKRRFVLLGTGFGIATRPYQPATVPDMSVRAGVASLTANGDGTYSGRMEVSVTAATDAEHTSVGLEVSGLLGAQLRVEGQPVGCFGRCEIEPVAKGATRSMTIIIWATQPPVEGGAVDVVVSTLGGRSTLPDANPADNTTTTTVDLN
jgi:hypothetical protein